MTQDIKPYFLTKSGVNGFDFYHYLNIHGGSGHGKRGLGGRYLFTLCYLTPEEHDAMGQTSPDLFCDASKIPCGVGQTIEIAYKNWKIKTA